MRHSSCIRPCTGAVPLRRVLLLAMLALTFVAAACATGSIGGAPTPAPTSPPTPTKTPWLILLCKFSDQAQEPESKAYFNDLFTASGKGKGGLFDYWHDISYGQTDLTGSTVSGWHTMAHTLSQDMTYSREQRIRACIDAAQGSVDFTTFYDIVAVVNSAKPDGTQLDLGSTGPTDLLFPTATGGLVTKSYHGLVVIDPTSYHNVSSIAHEMGHGYGLGHSWGTPIDPSQAADHTFGQAGTAKNPPTEYADPWDLMSCGSCQGFVGPTFGASGPELIGPYRRALGWMPAARIFTFNAAHTCQDVAHQTITLAALNHPEARGYLMAQTSVGGSNAYEIEFRSKSRWDTGIDRDAVIIHELRANGVAYLVRAQDGNDWLAGQTLQDATNNVRIHVVAVNGAAATATVEIGFLHAPPRGAPGIAVASSGPGNLDLFAIDTLCHMRTTYYRAAAAQWHPQWEPVAVADPIQLLPGIAAVSSSPGDLDLFAVDIAGHVRTTFYRASAHAWHAQWDLVVAQDADPTLTRTFLGGVAAASGGPGDIDLFAAGADGRIYTTYYRAATQQWRAQWAPLTPSDPIHLRPGLAAVSSAPGDVDVFATDTAGHARTTYYRAATHQWSPQWALVTPQDTTALASGLGAASSGLGDSDLFAVDMAGHVRTTYYRASAQHWSPQWGVAPPGSNATLRPGPAVASSAPGDLDLFAVNQNHRVVTTFFRAATHQWHPQWEPVLPNDPTQVQT